MPLPHRPPQDQVCERLPVSIVELLSTYFALICKKNKPGGLDLSWRGLDWDSRSRHFKNMLRKSRHFEKDILTVKKFLTLWKRTSRQSLCPKVLIVFNVLIETLDLNSFKRTSWFWLVSTVETPRLLKKSLIAVWASWKNLCFLGWFPHWHSSRIPKLWTTSSDLQVNFTPKLYYIFYIYNFIYFNLTSQYYMYTVEVEVYKSSPA